MAKEGFLLPGLEQLGKDGAPCNLGILGGTFDPIHRAHLSCAWEVSSALGLDALVLLPAGVPVFKKDQQVTDGQVRAQMCATALSCEKEERRQLAVLLEEVGLLSEARWCASETVFVCSRLEIDRAGDTFTIDTLETLRSLFPQNVELYFVVGADAFESFEKWHRAEDILRIAHLAIPTRPGWDASVLLASLESVPSARGITSVPVTALAVSSSMVRARAACGRTLEGLVPEAVLADIERQGLYRDALYTDASSLLALPSAVEPCTAQASAGRPLASEQADGTVLFDDAFLAACELRVGERLKPKRFAHSQGVADCAEALACLYGADARTARVAGLLHDWDKSFTNETIKDHARKVGVPEDEALIEAIPQVLHGRTAARSLRGYFPELTDEILQAIDRHTVGALGMTALDMILYCADALEPQRSFEGVENLRRAVGRVSLESLFFCVLSVMRNYLAQDKSAVHHPQTEEVFRYYQRKLANGD